MTRDDPLRINAGTAKGLLEACGSSVPENGASIVNPVDSVVLAMCEYYKKLDLDQSMRDAQISVLRTCGRDHLPSLLAVPC